MIDLVGIPYTDGGRTPEEGFDCYGVVRYALMQGLGLDLPEQPPPASQWAKYVKIYRQPPAEFLTYDVLMFAEILPGIINHIGIMISPTDFIHAGSKFGGVVCEPINRYHQKVTELGRPHDS